MLLLQVLGIAAVVGDGLVLVAQILRDLLGLRGGEPVPAAHVGQEDRQVVGQGRILHLLGEHGGEPRVGAVQPVLEGVQWLPIEQACLTVQQRLAGLELEGDRLLRVRAASHGGQLVVFAGHMVFDLLVPVDHKAQGGGLHTAHGEPSAKPLGGKPGFVHTEAGVRHLPRVGGSARVAALPVGDQPLERLLDVLLDVVVHVDAQHLALVAEVVQEFVHDELAFVVRVARVDHAVRAVQQAPDALHQIILALGGLLRPVRDKDGQRVDAPRLTPLPVHMLRLHQFQQMPGTGDHRIPVAADGQWGGLRYFPSAHGAGDVPTQHRLLRDHQLVSHVTFPFRHSASRHARGSFPLSLSPSRIYPPAVGPIAAMPESPDRIRGSSRSPRVPWRRI